MKSFFKYILLFTALTLTTTTKSFAVDLRGSLFSHDPATLIKDGDTYWHFFTSPGVGAAYSNDMINWSSSNNRVFQTGSNWKNNYPAWTIPYFGSGESANTNGNLWAPDVIYMNGAYYLYYSCSSFGSSHSAIGCVRSTSLNNPQWEDMGMVVSSNSRSDINAIDPGMFKDDDGKVYMVYGSFSAGIGIVEIDSITGLATTQVKHLAGGGSQSYEAPALFKDDGYYYLVINRGACCNGIESTYYLIVGRSTNVNGPYTDYRTLLPNKDGKYIGPGHFSLYRDDCANYVTTHFYNGESNGFAQYDILRMKMIDGWPVLSRDFSFSNCDFKLPSSMLIDVAVTRPSNNSVFNPNQSIQLEADASHAEGATILVAFYVNGKKVGQDVVPPFTYEVPELEPGIYNIYATATDTKGLQSESDPISIQVGTVVTFQENTTGYCGITNNAGSVDTNHLDYTGGGFVNTDNISGATVNWSVNLAEAGPYSIVFRYAASSTRPGNLIINKENIGTVSFPATDTWDDWNVASLNYTANNAGIAKISLTATAAEGLPNIDYMRIIPIESTTTPLAADCNAAPSSSFGINETEKVSISLIPSNKILVVNAPELIASINIYATNGILVKTWSNIESQTTKISYSDLKPGIYLIKTITSNQMHTVKFDIRH